MPLPRSAPVLLRRATRLRALRPCLRLRSTATPTPCEVPTWSRRRPAPASSGDFHGDVSRLTVPKPWVRPHAPAELTRAHGLFPPDVVEAARRLVPHLRFDTDADSVDGSPSFELRWVSAGRYTNSRLEAALRPTVESRVLPHVRAAMGDPNLVLCEALVRVYRDGQRLAHPAHFDSDALATAVVELEGSFEGPGFFIQHGAHVDSRLPIRMDPGDLVTHSFDLQHGVSVDKGLRCSVIFWFTDTHSSCTDKSRPWYDAKAFPADPGTFPDADAAYNVGSHLDRSRFDPVGEGATGERRKRRTLDGAERPGRDAARWARRQRWPA